MKGTFSNTSSIELMRLVDRIVHLLISESFSMRIYLVPDVVIFIQYVIYQP